MLSLFLRFIWTLFLRKRAGHTGSSPSARKRHRAARQQYLTSVWKDSGRLITKMSAEPQEHHPSLRSQIFKGKCGPQEPVKYRHSKGCKPTSSLKQSLNSQQCQSLNNYTNRDPNRNLRPSNLKEYIQKNRRKDVHRQWEESRQKGNREQGEDSKIWSSVEHNEASAEWEEFNQVNDKEQDNTLEQGERFDYGEELAQHCALDWEVDLGHKEGFDSEEGEGSLELLSDFCNDQEEEIRGVAGRVHREAEEVEGWEVDRNGKTVSIRSHCTKQSTLNPISKQVAHKNGKSSKKTSVKFCDKMYTGRMFTDIFPDQFYSSQSYSNGLDTGELCPQSNDTDSMFPDVSDAGEALADTEGLSECDLFDQTETSLPETEEGADRRDTVMLSVGEGSESSSGLLSSFEEEDAEDEEQQKMENGSLQDLHFDISKDSPCSDASDREADILSKLPSYQLPSSFPLSYLSESEKNGNKVEITETSHRYWTKQDDPVAKQTAFSHPSNFDTSIELNPPCASLPVSLKHEDQKSEKIQEDQSDEQEEDGPKVQGSKSDIVSEMPLPNPEEHVYEETKPKFQTKSFLQTRKYLMTRSISVEAPSNGVDSVSSSVLGRERLMLHPQSYCINQNFLGDRVPALTGSLGCLSPGRPCPSNDLSTTSVGIPPPFELSSITKRPIRKSTPALPSDLSASCRKLDFGFKRYFLPLRFLRKSERRSGADNRSVSSRSSSESSPQGSCKRLNLIRTSMGSPELQRTHNCSLPSSPSSFLQKNKQRQDLSVPFNNNIMSATPTSWDMLGVGSDEFINSPFIKTLSFSKPRSFSSPNVDSSVYENVLNTSPHYENVQLRLLNPTSQKRNQASSNDTDGYVDMSSLPGFQSKNLASEQETESAYTICSPTIRSDGTVSVSVGVTCTKKDENKSYERQTVSYSRSFYSAKELLDSETQHVKSVKQLCETVNADERLSCLWGDLPAIYTLHQDLQTQLETRIKEWDQKDGVADIILDKNVEFPVFSSFISHFDNKMKSLEQMESTLSMASLKQQLLQVIVRVLQYRMLLTDYLNNLSPDSKEYNDTKAALTIVAEVADQANDNLSNGANLLRLVNIEHSVLGLKNLIQPGRALVKEGTLMKVSRKCKQPRHLILMSDILLYTYPQQDGKFRLINTLSLTGMEVTKLLIENAQNAFKVEVKDISITLSASSSVERDDWFIALNRTIADLGSLLGVSTGCVEFGEKPGVSLGENAPPLVSNSQVSVCMNCPTHFSLTHRRHHCHACGKVVCRDCCRNKVRLKYMKNRRAKVCDKCYSELCKHEEGDVAVVTESPSRPLSSVFQNIHPTSLWRGRKGQMTLNQVTESDGEMSGTLQRSRNSKRSWKSLWFLLKDKVLYTYPQPEEKVACESLPLLGFSVRSESEGESSVFQLYHKTTLYYTFRAQDSHTAQRWVSAMEEATVL